MKKTGVILTLIIALITLAQLTYISAQTAPGLESLENDSLFGTVQTGTEKAAEFQAAENKSDFLKRQWGELLARNTIAGPVIKFLDKLSPVANPLFKYTIGLEPSFTWLFILALLIFIVFLSYMHAFLEYSTFSEKTRWVIAICLSVIIGILKIYTFIAEKIIALITLLSSTWWAQLIAIVIIIVVFLLITIISKNLEKTIMAARKKREEEKIKKELETTEAKVEGQEKITETITESFKEGGIS